MKRKIFITLILTILSVLMLGALSVSAATYGDLTYTVSGNEVTITDCSSTATSVTIPSEIGGKPVTTIGGSAFRDCTGLTKVNITSIEAWCNIGFENEYSNPLRYAKKLYLDDELVTDLVIPDGVKTIKYSAFYNCTGLTRVTIPGSVTTIGDYAFRGCTGLTSITIPDSVTTIGDYAFYGCTGLTSITIPDSVTTIGYSAFEGCTGLTSVTIPDSVTTIRVSAFEGCTGLTSVTIPDSVTTIEDYAFYGCTGLTSITIPDSVTTIGYSAFEGCTGLTKVNITSIEAWCNIGFRNDDSNPLYYDGNLYLDDNKVTDLVIPAGVKTIKYYAFRGCTGLTSVTIPDSVTTIGYSAFRGCTGLTSVTIPDSVTTIGSYAFYGCTGLTSITIPDSVTTIGDYAFRDCTGLTSVTIPDSVTTIGDYAFRDCTGLTSVTIPDSVTTIGDYAFRDCTGLTSVTIPDSVTTIGDYAFRGCTELTSVTIPDSVTTIGGDAFYNCTGLTKVNITSIEAWCNIGFENEYSNPLRYAKKLYLDDELVTDLVIPDSVTTIGYSAFYNCTRLTSVTIPDSVTTIGNYAFYNCSNLTNVIIGEGVELIPENAFYGCSSLDTVCLSSNVLYIRNDAFNGCSNLTTVFYVGDESKWNEILFYNRNENLTNAKIIYNAIQKTYSFVTNCDEELNDITGYAVFSSPVINNEGSTLVGWYDNEELTGNPVAFPYYGDNITLYASWTEKTGASFDDALMIKVNQEYTVTTTTSGQLVYFEFVPKKTKEYKFYSTGSKDTYGYLYNSKQSRLTYDDDNGDGNNFLISYKLTKGETYYIAAKVYNGTGTFTVIAEEPVDYTINSIVVKDSSGKEVTEIPQGTFSVTVSFTNVASNDDAVIVLARYNSKGTYKGLMNVTVEDVPAGATMKLTLPVDNINGEVAKIKAFCWASVGSVIPVGNSVTFPAQ